MKKKLSHHGFHLQYTLKILLLNLVLQTWIGIVFENSVDPDQMASEEAI